MFSVKYPSHSDCYCDGDGDYALVYSDGAVTASWHPESSNIDDFDIEAPRGSFSFDTNNGSCELEWDAATASVTMSASRYGYDDGQGGDLNMCIVGPTIVDSLRRALRTIVQHQMRHGKPSQQQ